MAYNKKDKKDKKDNSKKIALFNSIISKFKSDTANWNGTAKSSWREYRRGKDSGNAARVRSNTKKKHYPLWFSTQKVRQPLILSRVPDVVVEPAGVGVNKFQDLCCSVTEKLGSILMDLQPAIKVFSGVRDDALMTSLGVARVILQVDIESQPKRLILDQQEIEEIDPESGQAFYRTALINPEDGTEVDPATALIDVDGNFYLETGVDEAVSKESVLLKHVPFDKFGWDHEAGDYSEWEHCWFVTPEITTRQIVERYGAEALNALKKQEDANEEIDNPTPNKYKLIEFWYKPDDTRYIFVEGGCDFLDETVDPYELEHFFPTVEPIFDNFDTDENIPICEYGQVEDILKYINQLYSSKALAITLSRARALFDNSIPELSKLIQKGSEGDYIGVPNLATRVQQGQSLVQYLDVTPIANMIQQYGAEFQQEITNYDNITGYSDILRGISNPLETATAVEHKSQFAVHRHQNLQEDMQRFCRDAYRLIIDMAFSNFSDERLYEVLEPSLSPEEKEQFDQILSALKRDWRRSLLVNIELHSTIMLSEDIHKQQAMELAQTLTGMLKEVSSIAQDMPYALPLVASILEHLIRQFRGGRAFQNDIQAAIAQLGQSIQQQQTADPQPDTAMLKLQMEQQFESIKLEQKSKEIAIKESEAMLKGQLSQMQIMLEQRDQAFNEYKESAELQLQEQELILEKQRNDIAAMVAGLKEIEVGIKGADVGAATQVNAAELRLKEEKLLIDKMYMELDAYEKLLEERRLYLQNLTPEGAPVAPIAPINSMIQLPAPELVAAIEPAPLMATDPMTEEVNLDEGEFI